MERKMSVIRYLKNRSETYKLSPKGKQKENKVIDHIIRVNKYYTLIANKKEQQRKEKQTRKMKNGQISLMWVKSFAPSPNSIDIQM
jgi:hypothetical protein